MGLVEDAAGFAGAWLTVLLLHSVSFALGRFFFLGSITEDGNDYGPLDRV
jgi:hypothetical protein